MKQIPVYSDPISWEIIPGIQQSLPVTKGGCGLMQTKSPYALDIQLAENHLNDQRCAWATPEKDSRGDSIGLAQLIEVHSPLNLLIIMPGTHDFQAKHKADELIKLKACS